nr:MAG TPA: hypothetical protein [Caudoviricetes sp.]
MNPEFEGEAKEEKLGTVSVGQFDIHKERKNNFRNFIKSNKDSKKKRK